jgi:hypothetical protein
VGSVPGCLVAGYVDLATGVLLGVRSLEPYPQEVLDQISDTAAGLFDHPDLRSIEDWLLQEGENEESDTDSFQEFVVMSDQLLHLYTSCRDHSDHVVVLIARRDTNFGMLITKSRQAASLVDGAA